MGIKVYLRSSAKIAENRKTRLKKGAKVTLKKKSTDGKWFYVKTASGKTGYLPSGFFKSNMEDGVIYKTTAVSLNFRSKRKVADSTYITTIPANTKVRVTIEYKNWFTIYYKGRKGYVKSGYFKGTGSSSSSSSTSSSSGVTETVRVGLNMRTAPRATAGRIRVLDAGTKVKVLNEVDGWYYVQVGSQKGYVKSGYFVSDGGSTSSSGTTRVVSASGLRLRSSTNSSSTSNVIDVIGRGEEVKVLASSGNWYRVSYKGQTGYVMKGYFE